MKVDSGTKVCPACAETVKSEAKICRFCRHDFSSARNDGTRRTKPWHRPLVWIGGVIFLLVVGGVLLLRGPSYGSVREIVGDLEKAGIGCENEYYSDKSRPMIPASDLRMPALASIDCWNEAETRMYTVYLLENGQTDRLHEFYEQRLQELGMPPYTPGPTVTGDNWIVLTEDPSLAEEIAGVLGGRIEGQSTELPND